MKREIAATIFSILFAGTALAGPIESSELPPPARASEASALPENTAMHQPPAELDWNFQSSADLWLNGIPEPEGVSLEALAAKQKRYPSYRGEPERNRTIPTTYNWENGNWRARVGTNVTTVSPSPTIIPDYLNPGANAPSGGTGALNGRLEYELSAWQFYGGTQRALVANPDGTLAVNSNFIGGTYYRVPSSLLDAKLGTGFEVNPVGDAKARLEYRQNLGLNTEGFLAAERTTPFQHLGPDAAVNQGLKAGINRRF